MIMRIVSKKRTRFLDQITMPDINVFSNLLLAEQDAACLFFLDIVTEIRIAEKTLDTMY